MAQRVFFLTKLRPGADPKAYEQWVRTVDYPLARGLQTITQYHVTRITGMYQGDDPPPYDYLEVIDITELEPYRKELTTGPKMEAFFKEWGSFIGDYVAIHGEIIE